MSLFKVKKDPEREAKWSEILSTVRQYPRRQIAYDDRDSEMYGLISGDVEGMSYRLTWENSYDRKDELKSQGYKYNDRGGWVKFFETAEAVDAEAKKIGCPMFQGR